jgi:hypothetical protein
MVSVWYIPMIFVGGFVCGFFFYGCIDWEEDNWEK